MSQNFILETTPRIAGFDPSVITYTTNDVMQSVQYFDGLDRPIQKIQIGASPLGFDIVQPVAYDMYGREPIKYLPYTPQIGSIGSFRPNAVSTDQNAFYTNPPQGVSQIVDPFSQTNYEPSPLNRVVEQGAPGAAWQLPTPGSGNANSTGNTLRTVYLSNNSLPLADTATSYLAINYTATTGANEARTLVNNGPYNAGLLYVTVHRNENWKSGRGGTSEDYQDLEGHVVLKRTYNWSAVLNALTVFSTYYVYDESGNLAFILPPIVLPDAASPTALQLTNFCYQYRYDERNRVTQKAIPGKGWEYIVYNQLDKPVLTQDANQALTNQWTVTKYDALGREIMTGLWSPGSVIPLSSLQSSIYANAQWDTRNYSNTTTGYTITSYPSPLATILSINYYDDYTAPNIPSTCVAPSTASTIAQGLPTASLVNILGSTNMLWTIYYYDGLGRTTQIYKQHNQGGGATLNANNYDVVVNNYSFTNIITTTQRNHYNAAYTAGPLVTILNTYVYDQRDRKLQSFEQINGGTNVLLVQNTYNEIGQLLTKSLHSETGAAPFLQNIGYTYNERGWLLTAGTSANLFYMTLRYNAPGTGISAQYNGNISQMLYTGVQSGNMSFSYTYDQLNRLTNAASTGATNLGETVSYNLMGNISGLTRTGPSAATLAYSYTNSSGVSTGNLLQTVTNNGAAYRSYAYDANGNANGDGMTQTISYNLLNLPQMVTKSGGTVATYTYDAGGTKIANTGSDGSWDYIDGIVYNKTSSNNGIQFIQTEAGRAIPLSSGTPTGTTGYHFEYNLTDQLGNVRVSFDKNAGTGLVEELQEDQYYAFGLRSGPIFLLSTPPNRYLYNQKEVQTDLANQYDYGARFYDPVIARWNTVDPLAESSAGLSPYNFVSNNPPGRIDHNGLSDEGGADQESGSSDAEVLNDAWNEASSFEDQPNKNSKKAGYDGALLAMASYPNSKVGNLDGWHMARNGEEYDLMPKVTWEDENSSFYSRLFYRREDDGSTSFVIGFAGSRDWTSWGTDFTQIVGLSSQYDIAAKNSTYIYDFSISYDSPVTFVGHSLGGGLAAFSSALTGFDALTYNAAHVSWATRERYGLSGDSFKNVTAYILTSDPVNLLQRAIWPLSDYAQGNIVPVKVKTWHQLWDGHDLQNFIDLLKPNK